MRQYHRLIGFPVGVRTWHGVAPLIYSKHALEAADTDRYGRIDLVQYLNLDGCTLIEMAVSDEGQQTLGVYRIPYSVHLDIVYVVRRSVLDPTALYVLTVWLNDRYDTHETLDSSRYEPMEG